MKCYTVVNGFFGGYKTLYNIKLIVYQWYNIIQVVLYQWYYTIGIIY